MERHYYPQSLFELNTSSSDESLAARALGQTIQVAIISRKLQEKIVEHSIKLHKLQKDLDRNIISSLFPLETVYIYCPPCPVHINTGILICKAVSTIEVQYRIRVDCRLPAIYCGTKSDQHGGKKRIETVESLIQDIKLAECGSLSSPSLKHGEHLEQVYTSLDTLWIERTLRIALNTPKQQRDQDHIVKKSTSQYIYDEDLPRFAVFMFGAQTVMEFPDEFISFEPIAGRWGGRIHRYLLT